MEWISYLVDVVKQMCLQAENLNQWLIQPMFTLDGTQYSALYITTPLALIIILEYTFLRWLL